MKDERHPLRCMQLTIPHSGIVARMIQPPPSIAGTSVFKNAVLYVVFQWRMRHLPSLWLGPIAVTASMILTPSMPLSAASGPTDPNVPGRCPWIVSTARQHSEPARAEASPNRRRRIRPQSLRMSPLDPACSLDRVPQCPRYQDLG